MKQLIRNGDIILDGTATRSEKEKEAFAKLESLEVVLDKYGIDDIEVLDKILEVHKFLLDQDYRTLPKEDFDALFEELKKYKDIEDELGIDLITLFRAYTNGFYVKGEEEKQYIDFENSLNAIAFKNKEMFYGHKWSYQYVKLYDYGKTWALTKEELL